jgi:hypothetical protein
VSVYSRRANSKIYAGPCRQRRRSRLACSASNGMTGPVGCSISPTTPSIFRAVLVGCSRRIGGEFIRATCLRDWASVDAAGGGHHPAGARVTPQQQRRTSTDVTLSSQKRAIGALSPSCTSAVEPVFDNDTCRASVHTLQLDTSGDHANNVAPTRAASFVGAG